MFENPFLTPPQVESSQSRSWGSGFAFGFQGPPASIATPADVEDRDAFQQGVSAGQAAATNGLEIVSNPCVDLHAEGPLQHPGEFASPAFEALALGKDLALGFGGAIFGAVLVVLELSIAGQTHFDDPESQMSHAARVLGDLLAQMGISDSMELCVGGGVDFDATGCELKLTPVFRSGDAAFSAAQTLGRKEMLVVSWRTDQSGSMNLERFVN